MANKSLFQSVRGALMPKTDTTNEAGGPAYSLSPKHALRPIRGDRLLELDVLRLGR